MPLHLAPLALLAALLAACSATESPQPGPPPNPPASTPAAEPPEAQAEGGQVSGTPDATPEGAMTNDDGIVGTWELVAQEGYPEGQGLEQRRLTFYEDGRMVFTTVVDGQAMEQEMQYRLEGDQLVTAAGVGAPAARSSRWSLDGNRLVIEQPETGQRDVYRRVR